MGREATTLQQLTEQLQELADNLQRHADASMKCVCGYTAHTLGELNVHREGCQILKMAAMGDIIRVANLLGRTPTNQEYSARRSMALPSWSMLSLVVFDTWNNALTECRLELVRAKKKPRKPANSNPALKVYRRAKPKE